jgi:hypothetical protein
MKRFARRRRSFQWLAIDAPRKRLQKLPRVLEIAAPEDGGPLCGQAICLIRAETIVRNDDPARRRGLLL